MDEILRNFGKIKGNSKKYVKIAMQDCVLDFQGKSQRLAPVDKGDLRGSASNEVREEENKIIGEVGFNEPYALEQHENLNFRHPKGGQAKYAEKPLIENSDKYKNHLAEAVKKALII